MANISREERYALEEKLLSELTRIGDLVKDITPTDGLLSLTWFPNGHLNVTLYGGSDSMLLDAFADMENGEMQVYRV